LRLRWPILIELEVALLAGLTLLGLASSARSAVSALASWL